MNKLNNMELIVEMGMVDNKKTNNNIVNTTKRKKRNTGSIKRNENKKFTLAVEMNNNNRSKKIAEMSNNKSKKRSVNNNKRNENKKFTLEYFAGKCVEVAATKGFKIRGIKMWVVGMFETKGETYLLTVDKYGLLFWLVDLGTLVIAVTRYLNKSQDDNYDLNCHSISICDLWRLPLRFY